MLISDLTSTIDNKTKSDYKHFLLEKIKLYSKIKQIPYGTRGESESTYAILNEDEIISKKKDEEIEKSKKVIRDIILNTKGNINGDIKPISYDELIQKIIELNHMTEVQIREILNVIFTQEDIKGLQNIKVTPVMLDEIAKNIKIISEEITVIDNKIY